MVDAWIVKRAPTGTQHEVADLGSVLEVEFGGVVYRWKRGECRLLWEPRTSALLWFDAHGKTIETPEDVDLAAAQSAYERFKDQEARKVDSKKYPVKGQWLSFGRANRIDYHSNKWGDNASYTHKLGRKVILYRQGPASGPWLFVLRGGRLRCTARGLVG